MAKGAALCQEEDTPEVRAAKQREAEGGPKAEFDKKISGLRLRPILFLSKRNSVAERSQHSSVGELATGRWAFQKLRRYLWYRPFDWQTDCSGILQFWSMDLMPKHQHQRWKIDMLRFDFNAVHRPEYMLYECNLLSRYNQHATALRRAEEATIKA